MFDSGARSKEFAFERGRSNDLLLPDIDKKQKKLALNEAKKKYQKSLDKQGSRLSTLAMGAALRSSQGVQSKAAFGPASPGAGSNVYQADNLTLGGNAATVQSASGTVTSVPIDGAG